MTAFPRPSRKKQAAVPRVLCPRCAHKLRDLELECHICHALVPTHRCGHCYHRNTGNGSACTACDAELGLEPIAMLDTRQCPVCARSFERVPVRDSSLLDCPRCGGQFIDHRLFAALVAERREASVPSDRPVQANPMVRPVRYVRCPVCSQHMHRKNYGTTSGVIVDLCHQDGIWFDRGEVPLILRFVEQGGLDQTEALAARAQREREHRERIQRAGRRYEINRPISRVGADLELNEAVLSVIADTLFGS